MPTIATNRADPNWPEPNFPFLNNALAQTGWSGPDLATTNWRQLVMKRLEEMQWDQTLKDVSPFLEHPQDAKLISLENVRNLLLKK